MSLGSLDCPHCRRQLFVAIDQRAVALAHRREERAQVIGDLWMQGLTVPDIAAHLGVTGDVISEEMYRLRRAGYVLPYRYSDEWRDKQRKRIGALRAEGLTYGEMAERLGIGVSSVRRYRGPSRVPVDGFREVFLCKREAGLLDERVVADRLGWYAQRNGSRMRDGVRVLRVLGLRDRPKRGGMGRQTEMLSTTAQKLVAALDIAPVEVGL